MADIPLNGKNSNGPKALGAVLAIIAVIVGVFATSEHLGQRIDFLADQLTRIEQKLDGHASVDGHVGALRMHGRHAEKFTEVETQFRGMRDLTEQQVLMHGQKHVLIMQLHENHREDLERRIFNLEGG